MPKWTKEQEKAIYEKGQNIIVSAGAGSGKTAVLTARVIEHLKSGIHIHELLILTFTKAAAAEMKDRIRKSIEETPSLQEELKYLDSAYITTFDSFALSVLKKYHYVLGLDKEIGITESSLLEVKKKELLDAVFEELYEEENPAFETMISSFTTKDDQGIKDSLLKMIKKLELRYDCKEYLDNYLETFYQDDSIESFLKEYDESILMKKREITLLKEELEKVAESAYVEKLESYVNPILESKEYSTMKSFLSLRFPSLPRNSEEEVKKLKTSLVEELGKLDDFLSYGERKEMRESILKTKETASILIEILTRYFQKISSFKHQNAFYEFSDIAFMAMDILREKESIREELKNSFQEILIDEYQDTNDIQETFISYIAHENVYMVGDVKQSIYRFRNANPHIFRKKYNAYQEHKGGLKIDLLNNFRSRREVLEDINKIFRQIMDDEVGGANYQATHQMIFGLTDYEEKGNGNLSPMSEIWQYSPLDKEGFKKEEVEAFLVARDIEKKVKEKYSVYDKDLKQLRPARYDDFVILMDRSTNFELYRKIFEYLNVPLTIYKDERLEQGEDLSLIKNLLDFIIHIHDKKEDLSFEYDFVSIARSFLYAYSDATILEMKGSKRYHETSIYQSLFPLASELDSSDIYHFLLKLLDSTKFYEKSLTSTDIEKREVRMLKTLELAHNLDSSGYSLYQFKDYLNTLLEDGYSIRYKMNTDAGNRVKIMTIHISKGLEYPVCYFTGLTSAFNIQDIKDKFLYQESYGFILPYFEEGIAETFLKELVKESYLKEEVSEKVRLFYVALTRAREKMIFLTPYEELEEKRENLIPASNRKKMRKFSAFLNALGGDIQKQFQLLELDSKDFTKDYLYPKDIVKQQFSSPISLEVEELQTEKTEFDVRHFSKTSTHFPTEEEKKNMRFGTEIHELLEYLDFKNPQMEAIEKEFIRNKIIAFLNHPLLQEKDKATIYKEHEFLYEEGNTRYHGIIDCMLEYEDHIDLIDYKLKKVEDKAYQEQLTGYQKYLEKVTSKKVFLYLYSILENKIEPIC